MFFSILLKNSMKGLPESLTQLYRRLLKVCLAKLFLRHLTDHDHYWRLDLVDTPLRTGLFSHPVLAGNVERRNMAIQISKKTENNDYCNGTGFGPFYPLVAPRTFP